MPQPCGRRHGLNVKVSEERRSPLAHTVLTQANALRGSLQPGRAGPAQRRGVPSRQGGEEQVKWVPVPRSWERHRQAKGQQPRAAGPTLPLLAGPWGPGGGLLRRCRSLSSFFFRYDVMLSKVAL